MADSRRQTAEVRPRSWWWSDGTRAGRSIGGSEVRRFGASEPQSPGLVRRRQPQVDGHDVGCCPLASLCSSVSVIPRPSPGPLARRPSAEAVRHVPVHSAVRTRCRGPQAASPASLVRVSRWPNPSAAGAASVSTPAAHSALAAGPPTSRSTAIGWPSPTPGPCGNGTSRYASVLPVACRRIAPPTRCIPRQNTSEWTLDYPPFFAYFEALLARAAAFVEPAMLDVHALGYDSWQTVYFQRATVLLSELVLVFALHLSCLRPRVLVLAQLTVAQPCPASAVQENRPRRRPVHPAVSRPVDH